MNTEYFTILACKTDINDISTSDQHHQFGFHWALVEYVTLLGYIIKSQQQRKGGNNKTFVEVFITGAMAENIIRHCSPYL